MQQSLSLAELEKLIGQEVSVSDWIEIDQARINMFADATNDHQWIHLDAERCHKESPFGSTIAHGFLTLSLLPKLMGHLIEIQGAKLTVNYGLNKVRFPSPVPVNNRVRGRMKLLAIDALADCSQLTWQVTVERDGGDKPACVAESIMRHYW